MKKSLAALTLIAICCAAHAAQPVDANDGFLTGKFYQNGTQAMRAAYVIGMLDGFSYSPAFGAPETKIEKLRRCISGMNANTKVVGTIVDQYLTAHPEALSEKMQPIVLSAMRQTCSAHGLSID